MAGRLAGKVAIITGASRGLGRYCAVAYGREGAIVAVAARTEQQGQSRFVGTIHDTAKLVTEAGGEGFPVVCNVGEYESVEAMTKQVLDKYGRIDILMTNAGIQPAGTVSTIPIRHWELEFKINVNGAFYCIRAALPAMLKQKSGNIITISSRATVLGGHYGATKRAVEGMSVGLAEEVKAHGIAVNVLRPVGSIDTPGREMANAARRAAGRELTIGMPKESYEEAAVLLAMQTVDTCTGGVFNDAEAIKRFGDAATLERFKRDAPQQWLDALAAVK
jgi:NAD(P)-dependent dehydrogenase (short-subunit alcohol dehydrogenase family)